MWARTKQYKRTDRHKASHPLASTIQFSNHHHTTRTRHGTTPAQEPDGRQEHHPQGWRSGNPTAHSCHSPFDRSTPARPHHPTDRPDPWTRPHDPDTGGGFYSYLRRKEVIQPHLPVRLPCYDLVPIADLTLDGSPPKRVGPPASGAAHFHDLTGGVYKARERIHRGVADPRLLATPPSRSRVAGSDPN